MNYVWVYGSLILAAAGGIAIVKAVPVRRIGGALLIVAGLFIAGLQGGHPHNVSADVRGPQPAAGGIPFAANDTLIAVKTLSGEAMILNASTTPTLFVSPTTETASLIKVQQAWDAIKGGRRPIVLVGTDFVRPSHAIKAMDTFVAHVHWTLPVFIQEGPPDLYVRSTPTMIAMTNGHWRQFHGMNTILMHLQAMVAMPKVQSVTGHAKKPGKHVTSKKR